MDSFTSRFERIVPWTFVQLLVVALATWATGAIYTVRWNPELTFFRKAHRIKQIAAEKFTQEHTSKVVFIGGSGCATSIDAERLREHHNLPAVNLGLAAGIGARVLTRYGFEFIRPGDTLIVVIEPSLLSAPITLEPLGVHFSLATGQRELLSENGRTPWLQTLVSLRPGSYHVFTLAGKILLRRPLYRYHPNEIHAGGWQEVVVHREFGAPLVMGYPLSEDGKRLLARIAEDCAGQNIRVAYALPWVYYPAEQAGLARKAHAHFARQVAEFLPVLSQRDFGIHSTREHFADTEFHPNRAGASIRTDELAAPLKDWRTWSAQDLDPFLSD